MGSAWKDVWKGLTKDDADLVLWQWGLALSIRCLALALTVIAPHRRATRGGCHARHRADLGNLGLLGSAGQEGNHSHLSCRAEGREPEHTREGHKLEIWVCRWDHCITWNRNKGVKVRIISRMVKLFKIHKQNRLGCYNHALQKLLPKSSYFEPISLRSYKTNLPFSVTELDVNVKLGCSRKTLKD